jgi:arylsulfatase A-like enzyme
MRYSNAAKKVWWIAVAALLVVAGCGKGGEPVERARPNVVLILVDAMRPDRLGPYGFTERPTTPNLDRLAADGVVFERAISQAGWTVPSVASLFTGVYPKTHGVLKFINPKAHADVVGEGAEPVQLEALSEAHQTMAQQFQSSGYETAAILKSDVVNAGRGFDRGFDHFEFVDRKPKDRGESGAHLTDATLAWLDRRSDPDRPFFSFLHYMDPHASYKAPSPYYDRYTAGIDSELDGDVMAVRAFNDGEAVATEADVAKLLALYDAEIEYWDHQLGRLLEGFEARGFGGRTIVAITADHGEAFGEHGRFLHAGLYQENIMVPLIIAGPGVATGRVSTWVEMISLAPTLADLAGVPIADSWVVPSLAGVARGDSEPVAAPVFSEWAGQRCVITPDGLKLLLTGDDVMLFDLEEDPGETVNLAAERPEDVARLTRSIEEWQQSAEALGESFPRPPAETLSDEQIQALKSLGYL